MVVRHAGSPSREHTPRERAHVIDGLGEEGSHLWGDEQIAMAPRFGFNRNFRLALRRDAPLRGMESMNSNLRLSYALALVACFATGCSVSVSTNNKSNDGGPTGSDSGQAAGDGSTAVTDGGTAMCCQKLTDNTKGCSGDAMVNDECTCLPVPAGTDCTAALPDSGPIVTSCTGYSCCFTFDGGSCQCISPGDVASCYGTGAACSVAAAANGATVANSCP
jgi:hypothetical protein